MTDKIDNLGPFRAKIENYLRQKGCTYEVQPDGRYCLRHGSTLVFINPFEWQDGQSVVHPMVNVFAPVSVDIKRVDAQLTLFLAEENFKLMIGNFSLDREGKAVIFKHVLLGDSLDLEEFYTTLGFVAFTADRYDEKVSELAEGRRLVDNV